LPREHEHDRRDPTTGATALLLPACVTLTFTQGEFLGTSAMFWEKGARGKSTH
jgi:hypothetical protein